MTRPTGELVVLGANGRIYDAKKGGLDSQMVECPRWNLVGPWAVIEAHRTH